MLIIALSLRIKCLIYSGRARKIKQKAGKAIKEFSREGIRLATQKLSYKRRSSDGPKINKLALDESS